MSAHLCTNRWHDTGYVRLAENAILCRESLFETTARTGCVSFKSLQVVQQPWKAGYRDCRAILAADHVPRKVVSPMSAKIYKTRALERMMNYLKKSIDFSRVPMLWWMRWRVVQSWWARRLTEAQSVDFVADMPCMADMAIVQEQWKEITVCKGIILNKQKLKV